MLVVDSPSADKDGKYRTSQIQYIDNTRSQESMVTPFNPMPTAIFQPFITTHASVDYTRRHRRAVVLLCGAGVLYTGV